MIIEFIMGLCIYSIKQPTLNIYQSSFSLEDS